MLMLTSCLMFRCVRNVLSAVKCRLLLQTNKSMLRLRAQVDISSASPGIIGDRQDYEGSFRLLQASWAADT